MTQSTSSLKPNQHTITPHIVIRGAAKAIEFYKKVFAADEVYRFAMLDGRLIHATLKIGDSQLLLADEFPERECGCMSPQSLKGANATIHLTVPNVDEVFQQAVDAGAKVEMPPQNMFWGARYGRIVDPFGQPWSLATQVEDLTSEEIQKRGTEFFNQMACAK